MKSILNELGSIVLALVLAVMVWVFAVNSQDPVVTQAFDQPVLVEKSGLPPTLVLLTSAPDSVSLTLRARHSSWNDLTPAKFKASVDMSTLTPGIHDLPINVEVSDPQVTVIGKKPATISVRVEELKAKKVPVRAEVQGSVPFGYETKNIVVDPSEVTIKGPASQVDPVSAMIVEASVIEQTDTISRTLPLQPRDVNGDIVAGNALQIDPANAHIEIPIEQRAGFRDLPVVPHQQGQPAVGYRISNVRVDPATVKVFGSPAAIGALPGFVETAPINLEGKTSSVIERVALNLPESISSLEGNSVAVEVTITPIESSLPVQRPPTFQGLGDGLAVHSALTTFDVLLAGPLPRLNVLLVDDVRVIVDLRDLGPGTHKLEPHTVVPEGIRVQSILPKTIEIEISEATPTPTATPTPMPTLVPTETLIPTATARRR